MKMSKRRHIKHRVSFARSRQLNSHSCHVRNLQDLKWTQPSRCQLRTWLVSGNLCRQKISVDKHHLPFLKSSVLPLFVRIDDLLIRRCADAILSESQSPLLLLKPVRTLSNMRTAICFWLRRRSENKLRNRDRMKAKVHEERSFTC